ncbi:phosphoenolpyruvate--protein phosphotransferase [Crossiella cryophila]|uniref:Phosphoenolpyruvate-protein phosphotransferase n=1 Tax=Crossiella cryophila TaxID=43355 RepID=A0A7W7FRH3_9PSEU|nr:phosphoenolpyruvate--protein phosphotransferase [Crossiella cryophila]MBB4674930.1 phosphotransferase system enzyme I (PtsI) [Crossiella cryophila]
MSGTQLVGVGVSPGQAAGPVVRVAEPLPEPSAGPAPADAAAEAALIKPAADAVVAELNRRAAAVEGESRVVLETTAAMAADPALLAEAEKLVRDRGLPAPRAVFEAANGFATMLAAAGGYLAERARDVHDVRDRIVATLLDVPMPGVPTLTAPSVLVARDLAPADTAGLDPALVLALVTEEGGPTSHTAILARSLGIPAVVACRGVLALDPAGLVVDGGTGLVTAPGGTVAAQAVARGPKVEWNGVGKLADGHRVKVLANVGSAEDAKAAVATGAEGVGLFRTEFCFLSATEEPTVAAQREAYAAVLAPFQGKPVIVRTLDAGADKPLPFLNTVEEPNPALGVRGLRIARESAGVLDRQLEAIVAAAADTGAEVSVMAPMVATAEEAAWFAERARAAGVTRAGVMIEIPAAALAAREVLDAVDFVSLGTNDLAQYVFAADRMLGALATLNDPWQPALLRLIALVGEAATATGKPAGVCGEAAADPDLACVLTGLGLTSLSMNNAALTQVGARLAGVRLDACQLAARAALAAKDPAHARTAAHAALH